jgi:hypothetical protein
VKKVKAELFEGVVDSAGVYADPTIREITKVMKMISMTRSPKSLIAQINLKSNGALLDLAIDEQTAMALAKVFTDFRAEHPDGKAPPHPPEKFPTLKKT